MWTNIMDYLPEEGVEVGVDLGEEVAFAKWNMVDGRIVWTDDNNNILSVKQWVTNAVVA